MRHHIAIADRRDRLDRPPHRSGNGAEGLRLRIMLDDMHGGRHEQHHAEQHDSGGGERFSLRLQHRENRAYARRITRQLEEAREAQKQENAQIGGDEDREIDRRYGDEIDDRGGRDDEGEARLPRPQGGVERVLRRAPYAQRIFDAEGGDGGIFDRAENRAVARRMVGIGFENHRADGENDERHQRAMNEPGGAVADAGAVEKEVNATPKTRRWRRRCVVHRAAFCRSVSSIAARAASSAVASGPPAWARSGRPPPPLPPSFSLATRTRSTAL